MKVSCVVTVCGKYPGSCGLVSILTQLQNQTHKDIEIVPLVCCIDYPRYIEKIVGIYIDVILHNDEPHSQYAKNNYALKLISGDAVAFFAGDDLYDPSYLEKMVAALEVEGASIAYCDFYSHYRQDGTLCPGELEMGHVTNGSFVIKQDSAKKYTFPQTGMGDIEYIKKVLEGEQPKTVHVPEALYVHI